MFDGAEGVGGFFFYILLGNHVLNGRNIVQGWFRLGLVEGEVEKGDQRVGGPRLLRVSQFPEEVMEVVDEVMFGLLKAGGCGHLGHLLNGFVFAELRRG